MNFDQNVEDLGMVREITTPNEHFGGRRLQNNLLSNSQGTQQPPSVVKQNRLDIKRQRTIDS